MMIQFIVIFFDIITTFFDYWLIYYIGSIFMSKGKNGIQAVFSLIFFTIMNMLFASLIKDTFLISIMNFLFGYYIIKINYIGNNISKFIYSILYYLSLGFYTFSTTFIAQSIFGIENTELYSSTIERMNFILVTKVLLVCVILIFKDKVRFPDSNELSLNKNSSVLIKIAYSIITIIMILFVL